MEKPYWCEHGEKICRYTIVNYEYNSKTTSLRIQSWFCPECGVHGAHSEIIAPVPIRNAVHSYSKNFDYTQ